MSSFHANSKRTLLTVSHARIDIQWERNRVLPFQDKSHKSQRLNFVQFSVIVLKLLLLISKPSLVTITWPFESICVVTVLCVGSVSPHYHSITFHFAAAVGGTDSSAPCRADHNVDPVWSGTYSGPECFVFLPQHLMCRGWRPVESAGSEKRSGQSFLLMPPPPVGNSTAVSLFFSAFIPPLCFTAFKSQRSLVSDRNMRRSTEELKVSISTGAASGGNECYGGEWLLREAGTWKIKQATTAQQAERQLPLQSGHNWTFYRPVDTHHCC